MQLVYNAHIKNAFYFSDVKTLEITKITFHMHFTWPLTIQLPTEGSKLSIWAEHHQITKNVQCHPSSVLNISSDVKDAMILGLKFD